MDWPCGAYRRAFHNPPCAVDHVHLVHGQYTPFPRIVNMCPAPCHPPTPTSPRVDVGRCQVPPQLRAQLLNIVSNPNLDKGVGRGLWTRGRCGIVGGMEIAPPRIGMSNIHVEPHKPGTAMHRIWGHRQTLSPAVARAMDLWLTGAVSTKKAAAEAVGISPVTLHGNAKSPAGIRYIESAHEAISNRTINTSVLIEQLSRRAVEVIGGMMEDAEQPALRLKAAIDLADRGKETSKVTKVQTESFSISGRDVEALAKAMVMGAKLREQYPEAAEGDFIKVEADAPR